MELVADSYKKNLTVCPLCFKPLISADEGHVQQAPEVWGTTHIACQNPECSKFYVVLAFQASRGTSWYTIGIIMNNCEMRETLYKKKFHSLVLQNDGKDLAERINAITVLL